MKFWIVGVASTVAIIMLAAGCSDCNTLNVEKANIVVDAFPAIDSAGLYIAQMDGLFADRGQNTGGSHEQGNPGQLSAWPYSLLYQDRRGPIPWSEPAAEIGGRHWDRTNDLLGVNELQGGQCWSLVQVQGPGKVADHATFASRIGRMLVFAVRTGRG